MLKITKDQFTKWTIPSKASYIGLWVGVIGTVLGAVGTGLAIYFYLNPPKTPPTSCDEFVRNTHPTVVSLKGAKFQGWLGDPDKSLTLEYANTSKFTAKSFSVRVAYKGKTFDAFKSNAFEAVNMANLSIPGNGSLELPVVPLSKIQEEVSGTVCGIGFYPADLDHAAPEHCGSGEVQSSIIKVKATYTSIFEEKKELQSSLWLYECLNCQGTDNAFSIKRLPLPEVSNAGTVR
ncbi:hypothetical protein [Pseudomonas mucidolens]|uniref:hypothetical protein n=1 Tax=Pseudomonas mucidolens TaxID=46679 RepID=UPI0030DCF08B